MPPSADQLSNSRKLTNTAVWDTADKYLRNVVEPEEYGDYIIPFTVLRRIECLLADSKQGVLDMVDKLTDHGAKDINPILLENGVRARFGLPFYNTSKLDLSILAKTDDSVAEGLTQYLAGFSDNLRDIWEAFKFDDRIATLDKANRLYGIVSHFAALDLHPDSLSDTAMGDLFEDIMYRAFNTKGKGAGAFYTPRDAIELMVDLLFSSDDYGLTGKAPIRSIYDPAAGTGGMLLVARRVLSEMNPNAQISLAGQELMDYAYAMGKADLLIQAMPSATETPSPTTFTRIAHLTTCSPTRRSARTGPSVPSRSRPKPKLRVPGLATACPVSRTDSCCSSVTSPASSPRRARTVPVVAARLL